MTDAHQRQMLGAFIRAHRARLTPARPGGRRRTPGLRREELADAAGLGVTWITWLEQGRDVQASPAACAPRRRVATVGGGARLAVRPRRQEGSARGRGPCRRAVPRPARAAGADVRAGLPARPHVDGARLNSCRRAVHRLAGCRRNRPQPAALRVPASGGADADRGLGNARAPAGGRVQGGRAPAAVRPGPAGAGGGVVRGKCAVRRLLGEAGCAPPRRRRTAVPHPSGRNRLCADHVARGPAQWKSSWCASRAPTTCRRDRCRGHQSRTVPALPDQGQKVSHSSCAAAAFWRAAGVARGAGGQRACGGGRAFARSGGRRRPDRSPARLAVQVEDAHDLTSASAWSCNALAAAVASSTKATFCCVIASISSIAL